MRRILNKARAKIKPRPIDCWRRHPRVLLVEPDAEVGIYLQIFFIACGFQTTRTSSVKCALGLIASKPFDIVVTEWRLFTDGSGLDIIVAVRANPRLVAAKVMFLTVAKDEAEPIRSNAPDAVLYKPELYPIILYTLRRLLRQKTPKS